MGACSSSTKILTQAPIPDAKLAAGVYQISLHHHFARASSMPAWWWRKLYHGGLTHSIVANLSKCSSLVVCEFHTAGEEHSKQGYEGYERNLDVGCHGTWSTSQWSQLCPWAMWTYLWFTMQEFSTVDAYTDNLRKPQKLYKKGGWALAQGWAPAWDNTVVVCYHAHCSTVYLAWLQIWVLL